MLTTKVLALALSVSGQLPDVLDIFRVDPSANVILLLDTSGSMASAYGRIPTTCSWYGANYRSGSPNLSKQEMMKAALIGCSSATDGLLDRWDQRVNFAIYGFGASVTRLAPFYSTHTALENAVIALGATGGTPMTEGLHDAGAYYTTAFNNTNHPTCRKDYILLMSDGEPNGGADTMNYECTSPVESLSVSATQPWNAARYLVRERDPSTQIRDLLCTVSGTQPVRTYTVGLEALVGFNASSLQDIARLGQGSYHHASDSASLNRAFETIVQDIVSREAVSFSAPAVQTTGLYADNYAFSTSYKPGFGAWPGTLKKYCINPPKLANGNYDTSARNCLYRSTNGTDLLVNGSPQDLFTFIQSNNAMVGGTGEVLLDQLGAAPWGAPQAPYHGRRNIYTWREGAGAYVPVTPASWRSTDTNAAGCDHEKTINFLHGYTYDANCTTGDPVQVRDWPLGAAVNSNAVLLKYGPCHDSADRAVAGNCFVATPMNDGMVHFVDAANGEEKSALVPAELWRNNAIAQNRIDQVWDQPNTSVFHRYYVDGAMRLLHDDTDGDGIIDSSETARLVFGLGRGGNAYYQINMSTFNGLLSSTNNPIYPLYMRTGTAFEELRQTISAPYFGRALVGSQTKRIAAFGSGHLRELDDPNVYMGVPPPPPPPYADTANPRNVACMGSGNFAVYNGLDSAGSNLCRVLYRTSTCNGNRGNPCYDTGYWATNPATAAPISRLIGPLRFASGGTSAGAYRVRFNIFSLGSGDRVELRNGAGAAVYTYSGTSMNNNVSGWINDESGAGFYINVLTNGIDSANRGFEIASIDWAPLVVPVPNNFGPAHTPTLFMIDADKWNGTSPRAFNSPVSGSTLLRVAARCNVADGTCLDSTRVPALASLVCPISAEVTAYHEGDHMRSLYFGTECGEIWKVWSDNSGVTWDARRILSLNTPGRSGLSKNFRKIFRRLDIVPTSCPGTRAVGIYFGTGNEQRPTARDELKDSTLNNGRDVVGVIWDDGLINEQTISNLENVTTQLASATDARTMWFRGKRGWYLELADQERMLRDPLVFSSVAYFKTRQAGTSATECTEGDGLDRLYAINSCDGDAIRDNNGDGNTRNAEDRTAWSGQGDIGGGAVLFTPKNDQPIVSVGGRGDGAPARVNPTRPRNVPRMFQWRRPARED